jgi:outer membrane protein OmpA-like peptidoglycan-associated protein
MRAVGLTFSATLLSSLLMLVTVPAKAEDPSAAQIINSLQGKSTKFRSFDPGQARREQKQEQLVTKLRGMKTRQITVEERKEIADVVKENDLPAIDLEVFFDYDSAAITGEALPILDKLGAALNSDKLKGSVFMVAGHTDAHGSADYNLGLSNARARSVREFLIKKYHIAPDQLAAVGFGEEQLKNPEDPDAGENRRVQVVNMANKDVADKAQAPAAPPAEPKAKDEPAEDDGAGASDAPPPEGEGEDAPPQQ